MEDLESTLKERRYAELMDIQQKISLEKNQAKVGSQIKVLIDEIDWKTLSAIGRSRGDSPEIDNEVIICSLNKALRVGDFVKVEIEDASEYELYGKLGD
jgi:ribosomal protein S12 methylthiotransferase